MQRQEVTSSNIKSVGYDADELTLEIEFNNGGVYRYSPVPDDIYDAMMNATSIGSFFHQAIKPSYDCVKQ